MSEIANISLEGTSYTIKDATARNGVSTNATNISGLDTRVTKLETPKIMVVIGDSHSTTVNVPATNAWYTLVAKKLGLTCKNYAVGGTGYVRTVNGKNFGTQVAEASADTSFNNNDVSVVIVYGGINDVTDNDASSMATNCATLCDNINSSFPNAKLYIIGINCGANNFATVTGGINQTYYFQMMKNACVNKRAIFINSNYWIRKGSENANPYYNNDNNHPNELGDQTVATNMLNVICGNGDYIGRTNPNVARYTASTGTGSLDVSYDGHQLIFYGNATLDSNGVAEFTDTQYLCTNAISPQYAVMTNAAQTAAIMTYNHATHKFKIMGTANQTYYFRIPTMLIW